MSAHGVVALDLDRLEAFADALLRCADDLLAARLGALHALDDALAAAPAEVLELGAASARLRELGHDVRRRLTLVRALPWESFPLPTGVLRPGGIDPPYRSTGAAERFLAGRGGFDDVVAAAADPYEAAAALRVLGVDGFRRLYERAASTGDEAAALDRTEQVTSLLVAASRTVDRPGGLPRRFVDDLFPGAPPPPEPASGPGGVELAEVTGAVDAVLTAAGAGEYLLDVARRAVGAEAGTVLTRAGRLLAVGGFVAGVVDGLASHDVDQVAESVASAGIGVLASVLGGPVGWLLAGAVVLTTLVSAVGRLPGPPPRRTYPSDRTSPGGHASETYLDGAGIPVAPSG